MSEHLVPIATWNPCGLNMPTRRSVVCELASAARVAVLYLQETKLARIGSSLAAEIAGPQRKDCLFLPADGTRGGAAIFWDSSVVSLDNLVVRRFSVSATVTILRTCTSFLITNIYGPSDDAEKTEFLDEMISIKPPSGVPWLILGDFNLIYEARDKNNLNLCCRLMGKF